MVDYEYKTAREAYDSIGIGKKFKKPFAWKSLKKYMKYCLEADCNIKLDKNKYKLTKKEKFDLRIKKKDSNITEKDWKIYGIIGNLKKNNSFTDIINFYNNEFTGHSMFDLAGAINPIKIGQTDDNKVVLWYGESCDHFSTKNKEIIDIFNEKCSSKGIYVEHFSKTYPPLSYKKGCELDEEKFYSSGYTRIWRGCLSGIIINILD